MKQVRSAAAILLSVAVAILIHGTLAHAQDRGRGGKAPPTAPTVKGKVVAYEVDKSITIETKSRGGEAKKTEFAIVKGKTQIELGAGVKAIEVGIVVSVWADKDDPKNAAKIAAQAAAPAGGRPKAAAPAAPPAPGTEESADAKKVLDADDVNLGKIEAKELSKLLDLIKPAGEHELAWREIPWMTDVDKARRKAAAEGKMIVWFSLTDHPLGTS